MDGESVSLIYKKRNDKIISSYSNVSFSYDRYLESFLYYVRKKDKDGNLTINVSKIVKPIISKIKEENPYSDVNERERNILLSINDTTKKCANLANSEKSAILHNLEDMARALEEKQKSLKMSKSANYISIIVSIISVILTIFFGIASTYRFP